eukprot:UN09221
MEHKYAVGRLADSPETEKRVECAQLQVDLANCLEAKNAMECLDISRSYRECAGSVPSLRLLSAEG